MVGDPPTRPFAGRLPPDPPGLIGATWDGGALSPIVLAFDQPLDPFVFNGPYIGASLADRLQTVGLTTVVGTAASVARAHGPLLPAPDTISYNGGNPLFRGANGLPVPAWANFPVT